MFRAAQSLKPYAGLAVNKPALRGAPFVSLLHLVPAYPVGPSSLSPAALHPASFGRPGLSLQCGRHSESSAAISAKASDSSACSDSAAISRYCTSVARLSLSSITRSACAPQT